MSFYSLVRDYVNNIADSKANKIQAEWVAPSLVNNWAQVEGKTVGYRKDDFGRVWFKGTINGGTVGSECFVLPASHSPTQEVSFTVRANTGTARVIISSTLNAVYIYGSNDNVVLDAISFPTN